MSLKGRGKKRSLSASDWGKRGGVVTEEKEKPEWAVRSSVASKRKKKEERAVLRSILPVPRRKKEKKGGARGEGLGSDSILFRRSQSLIRRGDFSTLRKREGMK